MGILETFPDRPNLDFRYNYVFQWAIVLPLELVVAGLTLRFWDSDGSIHVAVWVSTRSSDSLRMHLGRGRYEC